MLHTGWTSTHVLAAGIEAGQSRQVDARNRVEWDIPGCRDRPIAGIHELRRRIEQGYRLNLRSGKVVEGRYLAGTVAVAGTFRPLRTIGATTCAIASP